MDENDLDGLSADELKQILLLGNAPGQQDRLKDQLGQANALRSQGLNNLGQTRTTGRVTTAPTGVETAGNLAMALMGQRQSQGIQDKYQAIADQQLQGRNAFLSAMLRKKKNPYTAPDPNDLGAPAADQGVLSNGLM